MMDPKYDTPGRLLLRDTDALRTFERINPTL